MIKGKEVNRYQISVRLVLFSCAILFFMTDCSLGQKVSPAVAEVAYLREQPEIDAVKKRCLDWLTAHANPDQLEAGKLLLSAKEPNRTPLDLVIETISLVDEQTRALHRQLAVMPQYAIPATLEKYRPEIGDDWFQTNLRFWLGLELSRRQLYEEALQEFQQVQEQHLVDPATYFFYRAVCEHHLLKKEEGLASLNVLLNQCKPLASRYRMVGELMKQDLEKLQEKSLDEIARKMTDVERRLDLGRAGKKVQKIEREIVESLDELIKKLEQQSGGGGGSSSSQGSQPNSPAKDSSVKGRTAPGKVDDKDLGRKDGWGNLPPKQQAKAKQVLGTLFPPHYRRAIEAYNRKAAQRNSPESTP